MARTVRNPKIDTRSARVRLPERAEPYWTVISAGNALGYRRGAKGGTWIAKFRDEDGKRQLEALVAGPLDRPFIVLLEQDGADQADNGLLIGEDADDLGAALDLAVQPFQRIGRVDLGPVVPRFREGRLLGKLIKASTSVSASSIRAASLATLGLI